MSATYMTIFTDLPREESRVKYRILFPLQQLINQFTGIEHWSWISIFSSWFALIFIVHPDAWTFNVFKVGICQSDFFSEPLFLVASLLMCIAFGILGLYIHLISSANFLQEDGHKGSQYSFLTFTWCLNCEISFSCQYLHYLLF